MGPYTAERGAYWEIHPDSRQYTDILSAIDFVVPSEWIGNPIPRDEISCYTHPNNDERMRKLN